MSADPTAPGRWPRRLAWTAALLLALAGALVWGIPALLAWQLPLQLGQRLGRPVTVAAVEFRPWTLALTLRGLRIGQPAGTAGAAGGQRTPAPTAATATPPTTGADAPALLAVDRLHAALSLASLRALAPVLGTLEIDGLRLDLARTAPGRYDIDDLIARLAAPARPGEAAATLPRFAVRQLALRDAQLRFDDRPAGRVHRITALTLTLPWLSSLPADAALRAAPQLRFTLDGRQIDGSASLLPFAAQRSGELALRFSGLDLQPWLPYLPAGLPLRLQQGRLGADLQLRFALPAQGSPTLALRGQLDLGDLVLTEPDGSPLARWQSLRIGLRELQPLTGQIDLDRLQLDGAELDLQRGADGRTNLQRLFAGGAAPATAAPAGVAMSALPAGSAGSAASAAAAAAPPAPAPHWRVRLDTLQLNAGRLRWTDTALRPQAALQLDDLQLQATALRWPEPAPLPLRASATLRSQRPGAPAAGTLQLDGQLGASQATLALQLGGVDLGTLAPYLAQALQPRLSGRLGATARLAWSDQALTLVLDRAQLQDLQLDAGPARPDGRPQAASLASIRDLQLTGAALDWPARTLSIARLTLAQPVLALARDAAGKLNAAQWAMAAAPAAAASGASQGAAPPAAAAPAWRIRLQDLAVSAGRLRWSDALPAGAGDTAPAALDLDALTLRLQGLAWPATDQPAALQFAARIAGPVQDGAPAAASGSIGWTGSIGLAPLRAEGRLALERLPLERLAAYAGADLPVRLRRGDLGFQGRISARQGDAGWQIGSDGDLQLDALQIDTRSGAPGDTLLRWGSLALQGMALDLAPPARPRLAVRESRLSDFYSRLTITEQGRLDLQDLAARDRSGAGRQTPAATGADRPAASGSSGAAAPAAAASADTAPWPIDLALGPIALQRGSIDFSDRFIRPNTHVQLGALEGRIGALRSDSRAMAELALQGSADGSGRIAISGRINPIARPLALDIRARATDLELAALSPYAGKYAGYAIDGGKLSVDLSYAIDADGRLRAANQVVLQQLRFGDRVASPSATDLPVLLAVALLKDRRGVIEVNLPVSGSLDDPQFSIGAVVWDAVLGVLGRALTAPFALLAGTATTESDADAAGFGRIEFLPGSVQFSAAGTQALARVADALADRPGLALTITGSADPRPEGDAPPQPDRRPAPPSAGMPAAASPGAAPHDPLALAQRRGQAVRDALLVRGLAPARLQLAPPALRAAGDSGWTPRTELGLALH